MNSKKSKIYGFIIGVGLLGLIADQLLRGGKPASARAADGPVPADRQPGSTADPANGAQVQLDTVPFAAAFDARPATAAPRDPFVVPPSTLAILTPRGQSATGSSGDEEVAIALAERFASQHVLSGVIQVESGPLAVVDDMLMGIGHELGGCRLVRISPRFVQFDCPDGTVDLRLTDPLEK